MSIQVSTRIDKTTKQQFDRVCDSIGISPSNALSLFIKGVINHNGIPFFAVAPTGNPSKMSREAMFGCMRGQFKINDNFTAPIDDFKEYM
jgi:DNA-damage-inducible protein J